MSGRTSRLVRIAHALPRYSPVGSKLSVNPNDCSQPTVYVPPFLGVPLLKLAPGVMVPPLGVVVPAAAVVVPFELFFEEPHPATRTASATNAAMKTAKRRYLLMSLLPPPSFHPRGWAGGLLGLWCRKPLISPSVRRMRRAARPRAG